MATSSMVAKAHVWARRVLQAEKCQKVEPRFDHFVCVAPGVSSTGNCQHTKATRCLTGNRAIWISIAALAILQTAYTYLPPFHVWFGSVPLAPAQWATALGYALACFLTIEAIKAIGRGLSTARNRRPVSDRHSAVRG